MQLKGVLFDLDGTLADTIPICIAACRGAVKQVTGRHLTDEEIVGLFGPNELGIISRLAPDHWEECLATFLALYEQEHARCRSPFPGIGMVFELLRRRCVRLGLVTGKGRESADISLRYIGLADGFDVIETGSPEGNVKAPAIRKVLLRWGARPDQVAYVGDSPDDVKAAKTAGVVALAAAWAPTARFERLNGEAPDVVFETVEDFADWIQENVERNRQWHLDRHRSSW